MNTNECSYCGLATTDVNGICPTCAAMFGAPASTAQIYETTIEAAEPAFENVGGFNRAAAPACETDYLPPVYSPATTDEAEATPTDFAPPAESEAVSFRPPQRPAASPFSRCETCRAVIPLNQFVCANCEIKSVPPARKSSFGKFVFVLILIALAGGGYYYFYEESSALGILRKYERVTGASRSLVFETYAMKGEAKFTVTADQRLGSAASPVWKDGKMTFNSNPAPLMDEKFYFEMLFKNPNKMFIDYYKIAITPGAAGGRDSLIKQGFNGTKGWKYQKRPNQPAQLTETGESDFPGSQMGLGFDEYQSIEIFTDAMRADYNGDPAKYFDKVKTFEVDGVSMPSEKKNVLRMKKKKAADGAGYRLLVFDQSSGFLVGMVERTKNDGKDFVVYMTVDKYKKFFVKEKSLFGIRSRAVLVPTVWAMTMTPHGTSSFGGLSVNISLNIDSLDTDLPVEDQIFELPKS